MKRASTSRTATTPSTPKPGGLASLPPRQRAASLATQAPPLDAFQSMPAHEMAVIEAARSILRARLKCSESTFIDSPNAARALVQLQLGGHGHEVFVVVFLDAQHRLLALEEMFRGTLTQTCVYPREVVRAALRHNAAAVLLAHNHPSGCSEPSKADEFLTHALKSALALVDVKVLDHLVVAGEQVVSLAERGVM